MDEETKEVQETKNDNNRKGFNVTALILGIISILICCFIPVLPFITAIVAIIFGALGVKHTGAGMGIAGLICSGITIILHIFVLPILISIIVYMSAASDAAISSANNELQNYNSIYNSSSYNYKY